jgi:hypothetical protein
MENARGGGKIDGKGNRYMLENPLTLNAAARAASGRGILADPARDPVIKCLREYQNNTARVGDYSNYAVLQGMSTNKGKAPRVGEFSLCGYYDRRHFVGKLHNSNEFTDLQKEKVQWDGALTYAFIMDPQSLLSRIETVPVENYSWKNIMDANAINFHVNMPSERITNRHGVEETLTSLHPMGFQGDNIRTIETSRGRVGFA